MIRFKQFILESLDNPYIIKYDTNIEYEGGMRGIDGEFTTKDGTDYNIRGNLIGRTKTQKDFLKKQKKSGKVMIPPIGIRKGGIWEVHFDQVNNGVYDNTITGDGDSQRVFATVLAFTKYLIKLQDPDIISIKSKSEQGEGSRTKLYNALIKRYASKYGYKVKKVSVIKDITRVELVKQGTKK